MSDRGSGNAGVARVAIGSTLIGAALAFAGPSAFAQESGNGQQTIMLDELVVTGEKIDRTLRRTASSVTVITAEEARNKPYAGTTSELLEFGVPNLNFTSTTSAPVIRGIDSNGPLIGGNAFLSRPIPRATISIDGRYLTAAEFGIGSAPIWDLKSLEVFRGPQTTTQGANAIAGAIIVTTNDPTFTPEAGGQVLYGSFGRMRASAVVSGPVSDELAIRGAVDYSGRDTFITYVNPSFTAHDKDFGFDNLDARFKALWRPTDFSGFEAKATFAHTHVGRPSNEIASDPVRRLRSFATYNDNQRIDSDAGIVDLSYDFGNNIRLTNQTVAGHSLYDFYFAPPFAGIAKRGTDTYQQETRLNFGTVNSEWSGVAGIFYSDETARNILNNALGKADARLGHDSLGLYSELTWHFADPWRLTGGLRYQNDRIRQNGNSTYVPNVDYAYDKSFGAILPKVALSYDVNEQLTVGGLISTGFSPGGTGLNFTGHRYYTFKDEYATNYELFARSSILDGTLFLTSNLFYTEYKDFQASVQDYVNGRPFGSILVNADLVETYGTELAANYQILESLSLRGSVGLLHAEISKFEDARGSVFRGNKLGRAPGYMVSAGVDWKLIPKLTISAEVRRSDGYFSDDANTPELRIAAYTVANARVSYALAEQQELFLYANNLFDTRVPTLRSFDRTTRGYSGAMLVPLEVGGGVRLHF